jgi:4-diphosphocytidyl-2-C-methyl-D-erythritol kinase
VPAEPVALTSDAAAAKRAVVYCPAKLNLGLEVLQRRDDGFHEVATVLQAIDLWDVLTVETTEGDGSEWPDLVIGGPFAAEVPEDGNSLLAAWGAARASSLLPRLRVSLEKNIPAAAGMGGGSSDGAGMLLALREVSRQLLFSGGGDPGLDALANPSAPELHATALRLGSDTPFFISGGCQLAEGRGEVLSALERRLAFAAVVAVPAFGSATSGAYGRLQRGSGPRSAMCVHAVASGLAHGDWPAFASSLVNDFAPQLYYAHPQYAGWEETLLGCGSRAVSISGSGSTMYGLFDTPQQARAAADVLLAVGSPGDFRYVGAHQPVG